MSKVTIKKSLLRNMVKEALDDSAVGILTIQFDQDGGPVNVDQQVEPCCCDEIEDDSPPKDEALVGEDLTGKSGVEKMSVFEARIRKLMNEAENISQTDDEFEAMILKQREEYEKEKAKKGAAKLQKAQENPKAKGMSGKEISRWWNKLDDKDLPPVTVKPAERAYGSHGGKYSHTMANDEGQHELEDIGKDPEVNMSPAGVRAWLPGGQSGSRSFAKDMTHEKFEDKIGQADAEGIFVPDYDRPKFPTQKTSLVDKATVTYEGFSKAFEKEGFSKLLDPNDFEKLRRKTELIYVGQVTDVLQESLDELEEAQKELAANVVILEKEVAKLQYERTNPALLKQKTAELAAIKTSLKDIEDEYLENEADIQYFAKLKGLDQMSEDEVPVSQTFRIILFNAVESFLFDYKTKYADKAPREVLTNFIMNELDDVVEHTIWFLDPSYIEHLGTKE